MVKKYSQLYLESRKALMEQEEEQFASMLARNLLCFVSGLSQEQVVANRETYASQEVCDAMQSAVSRVLKGEPLAYILGEWTFYGLALYVDRNVLIPRDDTCAAAQLAIKRALFLPQEPRILDLCTGSGCIGIAIASRVKDSRVTLADISEDALAVARRNVARHELGNRVTCVKADALAQPDSFLGKYDMIVSNPPYVTASEMEALEPSVKDFEPHLALYGGEDGLDFYRAICKNYSSALKPGGFLCFEFGAEQPDAVCRILEENGYTVLERVRDFNERERAVLAQYGRKEEN